MFKKILSAILTAVLIISCVPAFPAYAAGKDRNGSDIETVGIGGGGAFFIPMVNPTDQDNYLVTCDMGGLYWSLDAGRTWNRTESRFWIREAMVSDDGIVFCGAYGLYASYDKGATLQRIYPKEVKHAVSRCGWSEELLLADGYNNGYIKCIDAKDGRVFFITLDWYGEMRLISCDYDGLNVTEYFVRQTDIYDNPVSGVECHILAEEGFLLYTFGDKLVRYDLNTGASETIYSTRGELNDLEKIGDKYFLLDTVGNSTGVMYSSDLSSWSDLSELNTLDPNYTRWGVTYTVDWIFNDICGNSFDSIFISFNSDAGDGVLRFDGTQFHWVLDKYHKDRSYYGIDGWSYGCYGPFYGICNVSGDDSKCIAATIETVYELDFEDEQNCSADSLHCNSHAGHTYSTTGLDVQTAYDVYEDPFDGEHIIICTTDMGLQISYDGGNTWQRHSITDHWDLQNTCYDLYFDKKTEGKVYALWSSRHDAPYSGYTSDKVWTEGAFAVSYDGGMTWDFDDYSTGLPADSIPVKMFVRDDGDELTIAVACFNYGFYVSFDSGRHFVNISGDMEDYQGFIWGEDVVIDGNTVYCLTSWHRNGGNTPGKLYTYNLETGITDWIDLGDIVIPRSLTWDDKTGLYVNVVPYYRYEWKSEWNDGAFVNYGGGVYHLIDGELVRIFEDEYGVFNSAFGPDGTLYIASLTGAVYALKDGHASAYAQGMFPNLKNISFTGGDTMYVTSLGGGTYRMGVPGPGDAGDGGDVSDEVSGGASIYCWNPFLLASGSYAEWSRFFRSLGITRVYQCIDTAYLSTGWVNETVARLRADGIETVFLTGDRAWGLSSNDLSEYKAQVDALAQYNGQADENEKIGAVALDVETYTYSYWKRNPSKYFKAYVSKMKEAYEYAHAKGLNVIQVIPTGYDDISTSAFKGFVRDCSDELSVMNYDKAYQLDSISNEVQVSRELGRKIESIFETMPYNENYSVTEENTYFYEGFEALSDKWQQIRSRYSYEDLTVSYHYLPTVYHVVTGAYLAEIYAYTNEDDPSRDELWQPGALERIVLTGDNGDVITAGVFNPNLTAQYPETCYLAVGVKPGVRYSISDPDGRYRIKSTKTFEFEEGQLVDTCSVSVVYTGETVHTHTPETRGAYPASCTSEGYTGDIYCSECGEMISAGETIPRTAHDGELIGAVSPSCTSEGYTGDTVCRNCGTVLEQGVWIARTSHTGSITGAVEATCTSEGYTGDTVCLKCGKLLEQGTAVPRTPHAEGITGVREATCTAEGYTGDTVCLKCGEILQRGSAIPMTPHEGILTGAAGATCSAEGYTGDVICRYCGTIMENGETIPMTPHTEGIRNAVEATCTREGYTGDTVCLRCGELLRSGTSLPRKNHVPGMAECLENSTHSFSCTLCGSVLSVEECYDGNDDGVCDICRGRMPVPGMPSVYVKKTGFVNGKQYLVLLSGKGFGIDLLAKTVTMNTVSGGYAPREAIDPEMLWTYSSGRLSCEYNGTVYYLTAEASGNGAVTALTESQSQASVWSISNGRLSTVVAVKNGKKTKNTTFYMYISGSSVLLTTSKKNGVVLYEAQN